MIRNEFRFLVITSSKLQPVQRAQIIYKSGFFLPGNKARALHVPMTTRKISTQTLKEHSYLTVIVAFVYGTVLHQNGRCRSKIRLHTLYSLIKVYMATNATCALKGALRLNIGTAELVQASL